MGNCTGATATVGFGAGVAAAAAFAIAVHKAAKLRSAVGASQWKSALAEDGTLRDYEELLQLIADKGVEPVLRPEVWPMLLGVFAPDQTSEHRASAYRDLCRSYQELVDQCQELEAACKDAVSARQTARHSNFGAPPPAVPPADGSSATPASVAPVTSPVADAALRAGVANLLADALSSALAQAPGPGPPGNSATSGAGACTDVGLKDGESAPGAALDRNFTLSTSAVASVRGEVAPAGVPPPPSSEPPAAVPVPGPTGPAADQPQAAGVLSAEDGGERRQDEDRDKGQRPVIPTPVPSSIEALSSFPGRVSRADLPEALWPYWEAQQSISMDAVRVDFRKANIPGVPAALLEGDGGGTSTGAGGLLRGLAFSRGASVSSATAPGLAAAGSSEAAPGGPKDGVERAGGGGGGGAGLLRGLASRWEGSVSGASAPPGTPASPGLTGEEGAAAAQSAAEPPGEPGNACSGGGRVGSGGSGSGIAASLMGFAFSREGRISGAPAVIPSAGAEGGAEAVAAGEAKEPLVDSAGGSAGASTGALAMGLKALGFNLSGSGTAAGVPPAPPGATTGPGAPPKERGSGLAASLRGLAFSRSGSVTGGSSTTAAPPADSPLRSPDQAAVGPAGCRRGSGGGGGGGLAASIKELCFSRASGSAPWSPRTTVSSAAEEQGASGEVDAAAVPEGVCDREPSVAGSVSSGNRLASWLREKVESYQASRTARQQQPQPGEQPLSPQGHGQQGVISPVAAARVVTTTAMSATDSAGEGRAPDTGLQPEQPAKPQAGVECGQGLRSQMGWVEPESAAAASPCQGGPPLGSVPEANARSLPHSAVGTTDSRANDDGTWSGDRMRGPGPVSGSESPPLTALLSSAAAAAANAGPSTTPTESADPAPTRGSAFGDGEDERPMGPTPLPTDARDGLADRRRPSCGLQATDASDAEILVACNSPVHSQASDEEENATAGEGTDDDCRLFSRHNTVLDLAEPHASDQGLLSPCLGRSAAAHTLADPLAHGRACQGSSTVVDPAAGDEEGRPGAESGLAAPTDQASSGKPRSSQAAASGRHPLPPPPPRPPRAVNTTSSCPLSCDPPSPSPSALEDTAASPRAPCGGRGASCGSRSCGTGAAAAACDGDDQSEAGGSGGRTAGLAGVPAVGCRDSKGCRGSDSGNVAQSSSASWLSGVARFYLDQAAHFSAAQRRQVERLVELLSAHAALDPGLGYCQGMSDLALPFVLVLQDNVMAFWCFVRLVAKVRANFQPRPDGVFECLATLGSLLAALDPPLGAHLARLNADHCHFAHRMVAVQLRRELPADLAVRLWEQLWADDALEALATRRDRDRQEMERREAAEADAVELEDLGGLKRLWSDPGIGGLAQRPGMEAGGREDEEEGEVEAKIGKGKNRAGLEVVFGRGSAPNLLMRAVTQGDAGSQSGDGEGWTEPGDAVTGVAGDRWQLDAAAGGTRDRRPAQRSPGVVTAASLTGKASCAAAESAVDTVAASSSHTALCAQCDADAGRTVDASAVLDPASNSETTDPSASRSQPPQQQQQLPNSQPQEPLPEGQVSPAPSEPPAVFSRQLFPFVVVAIVLSQRRRLLECQELDDVLRVFQSLPPLGRSEIADALKRGREYRDKVAPRPGAHPRTVGPAAQAPLAVPAVPLPAAQTGSGGTFRRWGGYGVPFSPPAPKL